MATTIQSTMSKEALHASKEYLSLTSGQKRWIDAFVETSDANRATREAYGASDDAYIAMFTRKIESSPRIIAALDLFYGRSPKEKFLRDLQNDISRSKGIAKIEARRLYAKMVFGVDGSPSEESCLDGQRSRPGHSQVVSHAPRRQGSQRRGSRHRKHARTSASRRWPGGSVV
jgi:hypothetical protein